MSKIKDKDRIGIGPIRIEIRREQKNTCSSGRVTHSTRVTDGRGGSPVPVLGVIIGVREQVAFRESRNTWRGFVSLSLGLERRLEGFVSLLLARFLTLKPNINIRNAKVHTELIRIPSHIRIPGRV